MSRVQGLKLLPSLRWPSRERRRGGLHPCNSSVDVGGHAEDDRGLVLEYDAAYGEDRELERKQDLVQIRLFVVPLQLVQRLELPRTQQTREFDRV